MQDKLIIHEQKAPVWKTILIGSLIATIVFTILLIWCANPLWIGIFRLFAFAGFVLVVLIYLQIRGKEWEIELKLSKKQLVINYYHQSNKNQEEFFERKTIDSIKRVEDPNVWTIVPAGACVKMIITFTDTSNTLSLFRIAGRDLMISQEDARKTEQFLKQYISK